PNLSTGSRVPGNGAKCHKASVLAGLLVQAHSFAQSYPQTAVRIFSPTGSPLPWSLWTKVQPSGWQSATKGSGAFTSSESLQTSAVVLLMCDPQLFFHRQDPGRSLPLYI